MPLKWKTKILLAKIESSYGVDPTPLGANGILATNITLAPMEGQDVSRELELPYLSAQATIPAELSMRLTFRVELVPSGTAGTAPAWGPLLRACACAETISASTSVTYNPITDSHESVTFYFWIEGTRYVIKGARGTCAMRFNKQGIAYLEFDFRGIFAVPTEQTRVTPTLSGFKAPLLVTSTNTPTFEIDSTGYVMRNFSLDLGNAVETRFLVGSESVLIVDRADAIQTQIEAVAVSTLDPYTLAQDQTTVEIDLVHGTDAGSIATLNVPAAQVQRPEALANEQNITEWPLRLMPLAVSGNDQWTLVLT